MSVAVDSELEGKTRVTAIGPKLVRGNGDNCLVIIHAPDHAELGKRYVLRQDITTIGRGRDNDIVLGSDSVSRRHGRIERRGELFVLLDLQSTNGTYINDVQKLNATHPLKAGDQVMIGDTIFKYLSGSDLEAQYHEIIFQMTITDGLTGLSNRKQLDQLLSAEISRVQRYGGELAVMMIDIDHFKRINDDHGHLAGDTVLRSLAALLQRRIRPNDKLGRYGGEEFCLILPQTSLPSALQVAEELRNLVAESPFIADNQSIQVTLSIGLAAYQPEMSLAQLYQRADELLYSAKHAGRNRVVSMQ